MDEPLRHSPDQSTALAWSLALSSQGIPSQVTKSGGSWVVAVPPEHAEAAEQVLGGHDADQAREPVRHAGPQAGPQTGPQTGPKTAALPPAPEIDDDPARILGLGPEKLAEILGRPDLTRREPPAEIWQYRGRSCVFDVFLYEEAGSVRVTYLEARDESAQRVAERTCLNQLLRARLAKPLS